MHNPEFVLENESHKILWDFVIQTARRPDLVIDNEKKDNLPNSELYCSSLL